jgi:hypothetical protein
LFEDAVILGDRAVLVRLFDEGGVLAAQHGAVQARGGQEIARLAEALCSSGYAYVADPRSIVQARNTTLVVAERAINVMRRGSDGGWRYVISLIDGDDQGATNDASRA